MLLLVGDNAFHGISHLSQERAKSRGELLADSEYAAGLVKNSFENGADGFMFSVSESTLSILRGLREMGIVKELSLFPIVPYAYEYVSLATQMGVLGVGRRFLARSVSSTGLGTVARSLRGALGSDPVALLEAYLRFELSRVQSSVGAKVQPKALLLHEVVTDMALAFGMEWFFRSCITFLEHCNVVAGFETRNFAFLMRKFGAWGIAAEELVVATPFNRVGFQMSPSREECEHALAGVKGLRVIAMSVLAAGYLGLAEAVDYVSGLPNLSGVVVGVSKPEHASGTFAALRGRFQVPSVSERA